jgi:type II secretory pathway component PulC
MNVNRVRSLMLLVNLGLAGATGYTVYTEFKEKKVRSEKTSTFYDQLRKDLESAPKARTKDATRVSIKTSDLLDMTGDKPKPVVVESAPVPTSRVTTPIDDLLRIVTISVYPDRTQSRVAVARKAPGGDPPGERLSFGEGEAIAFANDAVVLAIFADHVLFRNADQEQELRIIDTAGPPAPGGPTSARTTSDPGNRPFISYVESKKDSGNITIKPGGNIALAREGEQVLDGVVWSTTDSAKGGKALRVDTVPPDSVLARHGVQNGDVLVSVNGVPMSTKSEIVDYVKRNKTMSVFEVAIQRRGNIVTKTVTVER